MLLTLLGFSQAQAGIEWVNLSQSTAVYRKGDDQATLLLMANAGERVAVRARKNGFAKVQIKRGGKWRTGYIRLEELDPPKQVRAGDWGFGAGALYSMLKHSGKKFETEDNVKYNTGVTTGSGISPWLAAQSDRRDFWRLILAYRRLSFLSSQATNDVTTGTMSVEVDYSMLSGTIQRLWTPFESLGFYYGGGVEASKALSATVKVAANSLPVSQSNLPTYFGGHAVLGYQLDFGSRFSFFVEGRGVGFFNQAPMVLGSEGAAGLIYWP